LKLPQTEIGSLIEQYTNDNISEEEMTSWLKTVYEKGLTHKETDRVVKAMLDSGATFNFSRLDKFVADKHSTGGIGDKVSLVVGPLMAAAGLIIPMIAGRSLGHTGGTLDKLQSIPGYRDDLSMEEFQKTVETVGIVMSGQTKEVCPADQKMYDLRDRTGTVDSIPLICGSIMSKKIAEGIQGLVMDVKVGSGAFMKTVEEAAILGSELKRIGKQFGVHVNIVHSDMNQPLGNEAGLWNEVIEALSCLRGEGPDDLKKVVLELGSRLLLQSGKASSVEEAIEIQIQLINNGKAMEKLVEMVAAQGGDISVIENPENYPAPAFVAEVISNQDGFIDSMEMVGVGILVNRLTIRHANNKREIESTGGIRFLKKIGDDVRNGKPLAICFGSNEDEVISTAEELKSLFNISEERIDPPPLFY
jgi:pyrimidine-nucleoside phosphorylase|tara:strand:+ start:830 stop:2083 length:1254 start_codon:yes stop_codon:yes gene_type:complete